MFYLEYALGEANPNRLQRAGFRVPVARTGDGPRLRRRHAAGAARASCTNTCALYYKGEWSALRKELDEAVSQVQVDGYCIAAGTFNATTNSVAVPFVHGDGHTVMAFNSQGHAQRQTMTVMKQNGKRLIELTQEVRRRLASARTVRRSVTADYRDVRRARGRHHAAAACRARSQAACALERHSVRGAAGRCAALAPTAAGASLVRRAAARWLSGRTFRRRRARCCAPARCRRTACTSTCGRRRTAEPRLAAGDGVAARRRLRRRQRRRCALRRRPACAAGRRGRQLQLPRRRVRLPGPSGSEPRERTTRSAATTACSTSLPRCTGCATTSRASAATPEARHRLRRFGRFGVDRVAADCAGRRGLVPARDPAQPRHRATARQLAEAEALGATLGPDIDALRALPAAQLFALTPKLNPAVRGLTTARVLRPIRDGWLIREDERPAFLAGRLHRCRSSSAPTSTKAPC